MNAEDYKGGHDCTGCAGCVTQVDKGILDVDVATTMKAESETECSERCALKIDCSAWAFSASKGECYITNSTQPKFVNATVEAKMIAGKRCPGRARKMS